MDQLTMKATMQGRMQGAARGRRQRGVAMPVVLIILAVMLVSCIYLMKSIHSTTLATGNLAYDETLSQSVDLGLHAGFDWLKATAKAGKNGFDADSSANGYVAITDTTQTPRDDGYWIGSKTITAPDSGTEIEYVIHRLCMARLSPGNAKNQCVQTAANPGALGSSATMSPGNSMDVSGDVYASNPQVHYVITARLRGAKGTSVTNQMIVLIGT